jgi:C4-dicarboxylate-specific signal transduction histidine kinase
MSPDSIEARLGRLEVGLATVRQRVDDLAKDMSELEHIPVDLSEMRGSIERVGERLDQLTGASEHVRRRLREREETEHALRIKQLEDAARNRKAMWGGIGAVVASALATVATVLQSAPG